MGEIESSDETVRMHEAHEAWQSDHAAWKDEVESWSRQQQDALVDLERIRAMLRDLGEAIATHAAKVEAHDAALRQHEHRLAEVSTRCCGQHHTPSTVEHGDAAYQHRQELDAHARLKAKHHEVMGLVKKLGRATADAAHIS